jgi:Xaa-Pro aminopeptidase
MKKNKRSNKINAHPANNQFSNRISKVLSELRKSSSSLVLSAPNSVTRTHDLDYPYRPNSDFYYLTGSTQKNVTLVIDGTRNQAFLVGKKPSEHEKIWDGIGESLKNQAKRINATLIETDNSNKSVLDLTIGAKKIYTSNAYSNTAASYLHKFISEKTAVNRGKFTSCTESTDSILHPMRLIKDKHEVMAISESINITIKAMLESLPTIASNSNENIVARTVEYWFGVLGATPGFGTIAASGKNAAILHYTQCTSKLKNNELLLLDCGAEHQMYCGDITRVFPVNGKFIGPQKDIYQIVLSAQKKAISKVKAGIKIKAVYDAALKVLIDGLKDLKVVSGSVESILKQNKFKKYFPHGIGHSLGIDVHDVGGHRANNDAILHEGMVFTVEPGLYFNTPIRNIPAMGIRIEDDVLVTRNGCKVLSDLMPKEIKDIEAILAYN